MTLPKLKIISCAIALLLLAGSCVTAPKKCMFICAAPGEENAEYDSHIIPQLEAWGYVVDVHYSSELPNYTESNYEPYDFIFLSETVNSRDMSPLKDIPKPMLCSDGYGAKENALAFTSGDLVGAYEPAQPIVFLEIAESHTLAAGYSPGTVVELGKVLEKNPSMIIQWAKPTIPIIPIAGVESDPTQLVVYGIEKGTNNASGEAIKNRVAVVGVHAWGYKDLTEAGVKVFKAGINWILEEN